MLELVYGALPYPHPPSALTVLLTNPTHTKKYTTHNVKAHACYAPRTVCQLKPFSFKKNSAIYLAAKPRHWFCGKLAIDVQSCKWAQA